jgi:hypothetical protein
MNQKRLKTPVLECLAWNKKPQIAQNNILIITTQKKKKVDNIFKMYRKSHTIYMHYVYITM